MTQTLQEALLKAGLVSKEKLRKAEAEKRQAQRPQGRRGKETPKVSVGFIEGKHHHHLRTECGSCRKSSPDVEYYEHRNKSLEAKWLCVKCADDHNILDQFRQTVQSQHAQKGLFQRGYGPTKRFK